LRQFLIATGVLRTASVSNERMLVIKSIFDIMKFISGFTKSRTLTCCTKKSWYIYVYFSHSM